VSAGPKLTWKGRIIAFCVSALVCALVIEGGARLVDSKDKAAEVIELGVQPYMMFVGHPPKNPVWRDIETGTDVPSHMRFNNLGFAVDDDFDMPLSRDFIAKYSASPQQRLVLITGGSVVYGLGATANDKTIAGQLEATLNASQSKYRYRVVNLGMGGWIAYQQFVGLSLFGSPLKPDWIVVMDGHNDALAGCAHGNGIANPYGWATLLEQTGGGDGSTRRGPTLQWLLRHLAIARLVTGMRPAREQSEKVLHERYRMSGIKVGDLDKQMAFYLQAQQSVKDLLSAPNVLYSSQPLLHNNAVSTAYRKAYSLGETAQDADAAKRQLKADLDGYMAKAADTPCAPGVAPQSLGYFMGRSALRLEEVVSRWSADSKGRTVLYANTEMVFPGGFSLRVPHFIDNAHMSDLGQRRIAEYFAGYILQADAGVPFDATKFAETVRREALKLGAAVDLYAPPPGPPGKPIDGNRILEGLVASDRSPGVVQLDETNVAGYHRVIWASVPATAGKTSKLTIDLWSPAVSAVRVELLDNAGSYGRADFNLLRPRIIATNGKDAVAQIRDLGKGWRRLTLAAPLAGATASFNITLMSDDDELTYQGSKRSIVLTEPALSPT
jgi:hypothetical protein